MSIPYSPFVVVASAFAEERDMLSSLLRQEGCEVALVASGEDVAGYVRGKRPDVLFIHELLMESTGAKIVSALKVDMNSPFAVVMMRVAEGGNGAPLFPYPQVDDVLSLPPNPVEVKVRVRNMLELSRMKGLVQEDTLRIKELERAREELTHLIVQEMKAPLTGLADLLEMADRASVRHFKADASKYINDALDATETLEEMVSFLLDVRHMLAGDKELRKHGCDLTKVVRGIADLLSEVAQASGVPVEVVGEPVTLVCDEVMMGRVVRHLMRTAILTCPRGCGVSVEVAGSDTGARVVVNCVGGKSAGGRGFGLADMLRPSGVGATSGLGLTFCRLAVEAHGGKFGVESNDAGTIWWFTLPMDVEMALSDEEVKEIASPVNLPQRSRRYLGEEEATRGDGNPMGRKASIRSTRYQFAVAVSIMSAIPLLSFGYLLADAIWKGSLSLQTMYLMIPCIVALVSLGIVVLMRHTLEMTRLRKHLEVIARGGFPQSSKWVASADFEAMGKSLDSVVELAGEKVRIIEEQSKALLQAEQQRVMVETVGAACHHLGQPATVIGVYLDMMKKKEMSPEMQRLISECQLAATDVATILHRLQNVAQYKTEPYLSSGRSDVSRSDERILKI